MWNNCICYMALCKANKPLYDNAFLEFETNIVAEAHCCNMPRVFPELLPHHTIHDHLHCTIMTVCTISRAA